MIMYGSEYFLYGRGSNVPTPISRKIVDEHINSGFWSLKPNSSGDIDTSVDASTVFDSIVSKAKELKIEGKKIKSHVKKSDIEKLVNVGYTQVQIETIYLGYNNTHEVRCDFENMDYMFSKTDDYIDKIINQFVEVKEKNQFEIGLKYPNFNWKDIIEKYNIKDHADIIIYKKERGDRVYEYHYQVFEGDNVVVTSSIGYKVYSENKLIDDYIEEWKKISSYNTVTDYQKDKGDKEGFNGGSWSILSSKIEVIEDIAKNLTSQDDGYLKDFDIYVNNLAGLPVEKVVEEGIKFEEGGGVDGDLQSYSIQAKFETPEIAQECIFEIEEAGISYGTLEHDGNTVFIDNVESGGETTLLQDYNDTIAVIEKLAGTYEKQIEKYAKGGGVDK